MEANFDLLIAGCNTHCKHCYVNGGPGKRMPLKDALLCIEKLDAIAAALPFSCSFTLDNEPINHPDIAEILRAASSVKKIHHFHHGMTTGIALMQRSDREAVIKSYLDCGCTEFGITLHGSAEHHDEIVRRSGAHKTSMEAAAFFRAQGADLSVSLMLNRFFATDTAQIDQAIEELQPGFIWFAIPNYTPHKNMPAFEAYRASFPMLEGLSAYLQKWGQDVPALLERARQGTPGSVMTQLVQGPSLIARFRAPQEELYLSVHPDCQLYLGNTGVETACLGDFRFIDVAHAAELICSTPGNRDYGAFYDVAALPSQDALMQVLQQLPQDRLYEDAASVIYRGLSALNTPTRILAYDTDSTRG